MKNLICSFLLVLISFGIRAQTYPVPQNLGSKNTLVQNPDYGGFKGGLIPFTFADTTAASAALTYGKNYNGFLIYTTSPAAVWWRYATNNQWVQILPSGSSGGQRPWLIGGNSGLFTSPVDPQYVGTITSQPFGLLSANVARLTINTSGAFGIGSGLSYGNSGEVLTSAGSGAPPIWAAASGGFTTADNGLTANTATNVRLGGSALLGNTSILTSAYTLTVNSTSASTINSVNGGGGDGLGAYANGAGNGIYAQSSSGFGISAITSTGTAAANFSATPSATNTTTTVMNVNKFTSGTAANNIGGSIDYYVETDGGSGQLSNQLISKWTTAANATRTSQFIISGVNSGTTGDILTLNGNKSIKANGYGSGTFTGTPATYPAFDSDGDLIESSSPFAPTWQQTLNASNGNILTQTNNIEPDIANNWGLTFGKTDPFSAFEFHADGTWLYNSEYLYLNGTDSTTIVGNLIHFRDTSIGAAGSATNGYVWTLVDDNDGEGTWKAAAGISGLTTNELVYGNSATTIASLPVATYPSLTELSYVKGVTSAIQTQIDGKISASSTNTLTNKRWTARVGSTTSSATPTINTDNVDIFKITALAVDITDMSANITGTPVDGDILEIQITGTDTRNIAWGSLFVSSTVTLPAATSSTATLTVIVQYYTTSSYGNNKYVCVNYF